MPVRDHSIPAWEKISMNNMTAARRLYDSVDIDIPVKELCFNGNAGGTQ